MRLVVRAASIFASCLVSCLAALACGGGGGAAGQLPCDVDAVLAASCRSCHGATPQFGAPMPLVTYADLTAPAKSDPSRKVYELVEQRTHDDAHPMPQPPNPRLGAADQKTIDDWIAAGAPPTTATTPCSGTGGTGGTGGASALPCTPDVHFVPSAAYTVPTDPTDDYVCFGYDLTEAQKRQIIAFGPHVDNAAVVHHMMLFQADASVDPMPQPCAFGGSGTWRIVGVWAPGNSGFALPPEAGIPLEGTSHFVVQVHYNNLMHVAGQLDSSGFDVCTTDQLRPNDADVLAFGTLAIQIPAYGTLDTTCDYTVPASAGDLHLVAAMPHMHKLGTLISTVDRAQGTGTPVDLGHRDPWDFNAQYWSPLSTVVSPGDKVTTRCAWSNPGSAAVGFGEDTTDEMCFSFAMYYPKITTPGWGWGVPSQTSTCAPTQ